MSEVRVLLGTFENEMIENKGFKILKNLFIVFRYIISDYLKMEFDKVVKRRVSIKKFSIKKPPIEKVVEAIEMANLAPTPGNIHILRYVIVDEKKKISKIADACQQDFIRKASYVVIICTESKQIEKLFGKRSEKYVKYHVGAAVENFLLKLTELGLASSIVAIFSEETIKNSVVIPDNAEIELILPVGYELIKGKIIPIDKQSLYNRLFFNLYGERFYKPFPKVRRADV